jgi:hypothetical protein
MNYILNCIKDKILETKLSDNNKAKIMIHLGKVERMILCGSNNWIQLLAVLTFINSIHRKLNVEEPKIY